MAFFDFFQVFTDLSLLGKEPHLDDRICIVGPQQYHPQVRLFSFFFSSQVFHTNVFLCYGYHK